MPDKNVFERYLLALRRKLVHEKTEHTDRGALEDLLQAIANYSGIGISVQNEPKRLPGKGAPDFKVAKGGLILGYVENKGIGENLGRVLKSDQIAKYKSLSDNIVVTDYLQFIWINKHGAAQSERLCDQTDLENPKFKLREERTAAVRKLLESFFSAAPEGIGRASNSRSGWRREANCFTIISAKNWCGRSASTRRVDFTGCLKFFAIRSFMN